MEVTNWGTYYDGENDSEAIQTAKSKAEEKGVTYKGESSNWVEVATEGLINIKYRYKYEIYYEETTVTIWKEVKKNVLLNNVEQIKYSYENSAENQAAAGEAGNTFEGESVSKNDRGFYSTDKNKVLYFINYARMYLEVADMDEYIPMSVGFLIIYIILIVFTGMFAVRYMKRVIYIAFLTMIAPVVALTYPLDKIKDRKSTSI